MATLRRYATEAVLFSTHSVGLARSSADRIYSIRREPPGTSRMLEFQATGRLSEFLGELSFSAHREVGFDHVLLVEGPTDAGALRVFLRKLGKDHRVLLLSLGGSSLINSHSAAELEEVKRIAGVDETVKLSALIDSEKSSADQPLGADRASFRANCAEAGIDCHLLERRALENYFTENAIGLPSEATSTGRSLRSKI